MIPKTFTELVYLKKKEENIKLEDIEKLTGWSKSKRINKFNNPIKLSVLEIVTLSRIYDIKPEFLLQLIIFEYKNKI